MEQTGERGAAQPVDAAGQRPTWWTGGATNTDVLLSLAATPGLLPAWSATKLAAGWRPEDLLQPYSPDPKPVRSRLAELGARFITPNDPDWPFRDGTPEPPCAWLFVAGPAPAPVDRSVAIVGGRRASELRRALARKLAETLGSAGQGVVSGGAVGVDAAAHTGCCDAGGTTVCVLGCGLDVVYPRPNAGLFARIRRAGGTFLTEHPPGARPLPSHFLPRNRLIAALAGAVIVVEASEHSGSLSTARFAGSFGAGKVLAVPGAPWDPGAAGCNALIRDGATLVTGTSDVFWALGLPEPDERVAPPARRGGGASADPRSPGAEAVLASLREAGALSLAELAARTELDHSGLAQAVLELELRGVARRAGASVEPVQLPG